MIVNMKRSVVSKDGGVIIVKWSIKHGVGLIKHELTPELTYDDTFKDGSDVFYWRTVLL